MKIQDLIEEIEDKSEYSEFKFRNPDAFFTAVFLILDLSNQTEQIQLDYFIPVSETSTSLDDKDCLSGKIAAFSYPFAEPKIHDNIISVSKQGLTQLAKPTPMQLQTSNIKIDIDDLKSVCNKIIKENNSLLVLTKIIAILKDDIWNLTCMDDMLGIVRIKINAISEKLIDFNKGSLMDFMGMKKK